MIPLVISGIGTATPPYGISWSDAAEVAAPFTSGDLDQARLVKTLYRRSTAATRYSVLLEAADGPAESRQSFFGPTEPTTGERMRRYELEATRLALRAAERALADADVSPNEITHLITVSCTGFQAPGVDVGLIKGLNLPLDIARTQVGFMGCHGLLNGLRVAHAFVAADPKAVPLVCAVELCSLHLRYGPEAESIVANSLFADGAGAVVGRSGGSGPYRLVASGATLVEDSEDAMSWRVGDRGFEMTLSPRIPDLIGRNLKPVVDRFLAREGLSIGEIGSWAVHPGGPRILSAAGETLGLDPALIQPSRDILAEYGNMSSPTILFIMERLRRAAAPLPCVTLGFGPGLAVELALFS